LEILKQRHVPFLVALNKVDMIKGWKKGSQGVLSEVLKQQTPEWNDEFEERLYNVVASLLRLGFESDAYYRVKDFRKQVSIVLVKREGAVKSKVKALFMPKPLDEMRDPSDKFTPVQSVYAAAGVKLVSTDLEGAIPGTPVITFKNETEFAALKKEVEKDLQN